MVSFHVLLIQLQGGPNINHRFLSYSIVLSVRHHGNVLNKPLRSIGHLKIVHMRGFDACKLMASRFLMPDCWLEVSLHPESPETVQLDQGFPWFFMAPEQILRSTQI
jgi:hypothetical protein